MLAAYTPTVCRNVLADELRIAPVEDSAEEIALGDGRIAVDLYAAAG
jgi:hypothetical protein